MQGRGFTMLRSRMTRDFHFVGDAANADRSNYRLYVLPFITATTSVVESVAISVYRLQSECETDYAISGAFHDVSQK